MIVIIVKTELNKHAINTSQSKNKPETTIFWSETTIFWSKIPFFKITNVITSLGQTVKALNFYGYVVFNFFKVIRKALLRTLIKRARNKMFGLVLYTTCIQFFNQ